MLTARNRRSVQRLCVWIVVVIVVWVTIAQLPSLAQQPEPIGNKVDGFPVVLEGKTLFQVRHGVPGVVSAEERAQVITQRLLQVANDTTILPDDFRVDSQNNGAIVKAGDVVVLTVQEADAEAIEMTPAVAANKAAEMMKASVKEYREQRSLQRLIEGGIFSVLSTIAFIVLGL